jgi:ComF family protein
MALGLFEETNLLGRLIYSYKYNFLDEALPVFDRFIREFIEKERQIFSQIDLVVPVPLHRRRLAERGFNQAEKIGEIVSKYLGVSLEDVVKRKRATRQQAKLGRSERLQNMQDAFVLKNNIVVGKNILLIDDVLTTGSTLNECAKVLRDSGAQTVLAFTLARG